MSSATDTAVLDSEDTLPGGPGRLRALDGLRGVAVLAVMLFHTSSSPLAGGYLGVDVFFVLSGFLIAGILIDQAARGGSVRLGDFWLRRARRLAPPLLVLLLVVAVARVAVDQPEAATWRGDILAALTYTTNWYQILIDSDYFAAFGIESPLLHTWSLAIEEQFYLAFALMMALVLGRLSGKALAVLLAALAAGSAIWMIALAATDPTWAYYSTTTRIQSLLIGALLALFVRRTPRWWEPPRGPLRTWVGVLSLLGLTLAFVLPVASGTMFRGGFTVVALVSVGVIWAALAQGPVQTMLSWRPLVALGVISYGVYLWHWPIFVWLGTRREASVGEQAWAIVLTVLVSTLSYLVIERPIRAGRFTRWRSGWQWACYAGVAVVIAGLALLPARTAEADTELVWPAADEVPDRIFGAGDSTMLALGVPFPQQRYPDTVVWGPAEMGCGIVDTAYTMNGMTVQADKCLAWRQTWQEKFAQYEADVSIISSWVWDAFDRSVAGMPRAPGTPEFDSAYISAFQDAARIASDGGRIPVYILGVPCMAAERDQDVLNDPQRITRLNELLAQAVASVPNARFVDMAPMTCQADGTGVRFSNGQLLRQDGVHWTPAGAQQVWVMLLNRMVADRVAPASATPTMTP